MEDVIFFVSSLYFMKLQRCILCVICKKCKTLCDCHGEEKNLMKDQGSCEPVYVCLPINQLDCSRN